MRSFISILFFSYSLLVDLDFKTDFISLFNIVFKQEIVIWDISQDSSDQKMFLLYRTQSFQYQVGAQQRWCHIWKQCIGVLCNDKGIQFEVEVGKISSHRLSVCNSLLFTFLILKTSYNCVEVPVQVLFLVQNIFCSCLFWLMWFLVLME